MRALIIPTYFDGGGRNAASARIRARWVAKYWEGCDLYDGTQSFLGYDAVIWQKCYYRDHWRACAAELRDRGVAQALDLCDPVWLQGGARQLREMLPLMDFAAAPTEAIREYLGRFLPAYVIPDRMDLEAHPEQKAFGPTLRQAQGDAPAHAVWFGLSANYEAVTEFLPTLEKYGVRLTCLADRPYPHPEVGFVPWAEGTANQAIIRYDLAINPPGSHWRWRYKSNNKSVTAWVLGMPVAHDEAELRWHLEMRQADPTGAMRDEVWSRQRAEARRQHDVRLSARRWAELMAAYVMPRRGTQG